MRRLPLAAIALVLMLLTPGVLWAFGARQPLLENKPKEAFPDLNRGTVRNDETFRQIDRALLDRWPLRAEAIDVNARLSLDVFRDNPNPDVLLGESGWLYFREELQTCGAAPPVTDPADAVEILARTLALSKDASTVVVAGSKLRIHPQDAPDEERKRRACIRALEDRIADRLAATTGALDIDAPLRELEEQGDATFLRRDTHWNDRGREQFARRVLEALRPGLARETGLRLGPEVDRPADLRKLMGLRGSDRDRVLIADRTPRRPLRDVLLIGDSQLEFAFKEPPGPGFPPLVERTLPGAQLCSLVALREGQCDAQIAAARHVVFETVARNIREFTEQCWRPVRIAAAPLRGVSGRYDRADTGPGRRALRLAAGETAQTRFDLPGRDVVNAPRLISIPVREGIVAMGQVPGAVPPVPCATPVPSGPGDRLVLPVPANRRVSDVLVNITASQAARLGAPQEIRPDRVRPRGR